MADQPQPVDQDNKHWVYLFRLCSVVITGVMVYCFCITFLPIPKDNQETARQVLIFFIGTLVGYCLNMLSPGIATTKKTADSTVTNTGDSPVTNVAPVDEKD